MRYTFLLAIILIVTLKVQAQEKMDILNSQLAESYLSSHSTERILILDSFRQSFKKNEGVIRVHISESAPFLIIQGVEKLEYYPELVRPLGHLIENNISTHLFTWNGRSSIFSTQKILARSIEGILKKYPGKDLTIVAHSAGGIVGTLALYHLSSEFSDRVKFHSVATPYYGYNAPWAAYIGSPFVGLGPIQIGRGISKEIQELKLKGCSHWITVNCELDKHACLYGEVFPQTGSQSETQKLPCGRDNVIKLDDEDHTGALYRVIKEILKKN